MSGPLPRPVRPRGSESWARWAAHLAGCETPNLCETRRVQTRVDGVEMDNTASDSSESAA